LASTAAWYASRGLRNAVPLQRRRCTRASPCHDRGVISVLLHSGIGPAQRAVMEMFQAGQ
jgi:hypothetical protein